MDEPPAILKDWFTDDELELCPRCAGKTLLPAADGVDLRVCSTCGVLTEASEASTPSGSTAS
jgi:hypothetical protein